MSVPSDNVDFLKKRGSEEPEAIETGDRTATSDERILVCTALCSFPSVFSSQRMLPRRADGVD